jgi:hypothetical protein
LEDPLVDMTEVRRGWQRLAEAVIASAINDVLTLPSEDANYRSAKEFLSQRDVFGIDVFCDMGDILYDWLDRAKEK